MNRAHSDWDRIPVDRAIEVAEAAGASYTRTIDQLQIDQLQIDLAGKRGSFRIDAKGLVDSGGLRRLGLRP